jgi:hypothetical protein
MSRATNSFEHLRAATESADASVKTDELRASVKAQLAVLADALDGSVAAIDVEKALSELHFHHPPSAVLSEIEIALSKMVKEVVLAGNAPLKAAMSLIEPVTIGELPGLLVESVREALDVIMDVSEQRTQQAIAGLHNGLQDHLADLAESGAGGLKAHMESLNTTIANLESAARGPETDPSTVASLATKANKAADKTLLESMAVLTEKTFVIHMCRDTIKKMESAKKRVSAENKVARRALVDDPTLDLPDIHEETKLQQNIDAEIKDMTSAERERSSFACQCFNVQMVLKISYKVNVDALKALNKLIGNKLSAHWDAQKSAEVKTLQSRFITDNICMLWALAPMSARIRDHGTGADWRVPTVQEIRHPMDGEDLDKYYARLAALGFASYPPEQYLIDEYAGKRAIPAPQAETLLRREQVNAMLKEYFDANEYAFNMLKDQLPLVVPQVVLSRGQISGDSSTEVVNKATEHDYLSVVEQFVIASSTHSVFQADDALDALRASSGLFMMDDWKEGVRIARSRIQACANLHIKVSHSATVYKFMLRMRSGNPAAFTHLQLEYASIPAHDATQDYLPRLVTFVGAYEHFMTITRTMDRRLGGSKKHRAAAVKQAMAFEEESSDDEELTVRVAGYEKPGKGKTPLNFKTKEEQQKQTVRNSSGRRLCDVKGCGAVLTTSELEVVGKVQTKSDHRYKGSRFFKKEFSYGPFKQARCDACCRKAHESGIPSVMRDGFKLKGYAVDKVRVTRDEPEPEAE